MKGIVLAGGTGSRLHPLGERASVGSSTINAMSETAAEKPAFRDAMRRRRCLIPADGFYEWQKVRPKHRQPYNFGMLDDAVFAFVGLWDRWRDSAGQVVETSTILTTRPNALVADLHDRMPAILKPEDYDLWLDPGVTNPVHVADFLQPFETKLMKKYPLSARVNSPENDDPVCVLEVPLIGTIQTLF